MYNLTNLSMIFIYSKQIRTLWAVSTRRWLSITYVYHLQNTCKLLN